jgi:threonine dehydrogenase-like Zn-dependent dehydrogenase
LLAVRFHYRPVRYLWTRYAARRSQALALGRLGCVSLDEVAVPRLPGDRWVRVETILSGVCGSDLSAITAHDSFTLEPFGAYPFTFGHENLGRVAEVGPGVSGWTPGDRVVVNPMLACRQRELEPCAACARGDYGLCRSIIGGSLGTGPMTGYHPAVGGGWSSAFVAHESQLHAAGTLSDEVAVLADPLASALRPVLLHPPVQGDHVLVVGAGTIGLLTVLALRRTGWKGPLAVQARHGFQADLARRCGADTVLRSPEEVRAWAAGLPGARLYEPSLAPNFVEGGPSLIYDTVGSQGTVSQALGMTREGGRLILVGGAARLTADWTRVWYRQLTVAGIFAYGRVPVQGADRDIYDAALSLLRDGDWASYGLLTHVFGVEDYRAALRTALDKSGHRSVKVAFRLGA